MHQSFVLLEIGISIEKIILFFSRPINPNFSSSLPVKLQIDLVSPGIYVFKTALNLEFSLKKKIV